ncbi:MAG: MaoC family dehydratase [Dehalococcoidales bacterium]|nr:MaoC family dehydratase [Dehalococcoidales bacterium]
MPQEEWAYTMTWDDVVPDNNWKLVRDIRLTTEMNQQFMDALDDHNPLYIDDSPYGASIAIPGLLHELAFEAMIRSFPIAPPSGSTSYHAKQETELHYPVKIGERVKIEVRLTDKYVKREKNYVLHEARLIDENGKMVMLSRHYRMVGRRD